MELCTDGDLADYMFGTLFFSYLKCNFKTQIIFFLLFFNGISALKKKKRVMSEYTARRFLNQIGNNIVCYLNDYVSLSFL